MFLLHSPHKVSRETHLKTKHFTLHISHLIIYSGVFVAAHAGAGGFDVSVMIELGRFLDEGAPLHFVFIGVDDEILFAFPSALAFVIRVAIDDPVPGDPAVDFVDGIVFDIEYLVQFLVLIDIDGILCAIDRKVPSVLRGFPIVFLDLAYFGRVNFPVGNVGGSFFDIVSETRLVQVQAVKMSACPVIFDGIDQPVLLLIETVRQNFAGHGECIIPEIRCEVIKRVSDAVDRMGI